MTPRSASRTSGSPFAPMMKVDGEDDGPRRAWAFRPDGSDGNMRMGSGSNVSDIVGGVRPPTRAASPLHHVPAASSSAAARASSGSYATYQGGRPAALSPARAQHPGAIYFPRSPSPMSHAPAAQGAVHPSAMMRTASPGATAGYGFSWAQAPSMYSPRGGAASFGGTAAARAASPVGAAKPLNQGFAWSPEPASPRATSPRSFSPSPAARRVASPQGLGGCSGNLPRWGGALPP